MFTCIYTYAFKYLCMFNRYSSVPYLLINSFLGLPAAATSKTVAAADSLKKTIYLQIKNRKMLTEHTYIYVFICMYVCIHINQYT